MAEGIVGKVTPRRCQTIPQAELYLTRQQVDEMSLHHVPLHLLHRSIRNICRLVQSDLDRQGQYQGELMSKSRTVNFALEPLITNFAKQLGNALLSVHPNSHGIIMVAEQTGK